MEVGDLVAIYAAIIGTLVFVWNLLRARRRIIIKAWSGVKEDQIFITVINKSGARIRISDIGFSCRSGNMFGIPSDARTFDGKGWQKENEMDFVELEDDARCVFWVSAKVIRAAYRRAFSNQTVRYAAVIDLHGRMHKGVIPLQIKKNYSLT
ncbi:MAG: hypothetical protein V1932_00990 [Chloroflexota bacterium]